MEQRTPPADTRSAPREPAAVLSEQKRQIRALKRMLIAKAEVRHLKSPIGRKRITAR
jgi:hypothetical protein